MKSSTTSGTPKYRGGQLVTVYRTVYRITKQPDVLITVCEICEAKSHGVCSKLNCYENLQRNCNLKLVKHKG